MRPASLGISIPRGLFDGCKYLYVDLGCNVGTKLRQFWEAEIYTGAHKNERTGTGALFDAFFPKPPERRAHANEMCAIGFEANAHHEARLRQIETCFQSKGWRLHAFVPVAVADHAGGIEMCSDNKPEFQEWGFSAFRAKGSRQCAKVPSINITYFLEGVIALGIRNIIIKMDIEGMEWQVLPPLTRAGLLCRERGVHALTVEFHSTYDINGEAHADSVRRALKYQHCTSSYGELGDDESYLWDRHWGKTPATQGKFGRPIRLPCEPADPEAKLDKYGHPRGGLSYWETFDGMGDG